MTPEAMSKLVARWVRFYTRGLSTEIAQRRVDEIDADLHDHIAHERARGISDRRIALGIASRMVRGLGRRSYDNSIQAWGGKGPLGEVPCFVVTHRPPVSSDPVFTFVTDGVERALAKAKEAAAEKRIGLMGANIDQQFLAGVAPERRKLCWRPVAAKMPW